LIIGIWAQIRVSSAFGRWSKVRASSNITGAEAAREILQAAQIHDVEVVETNDFLGDHYDPTSKRLCLSSERLQHAVGRASGSPRTKPGTPSNTRPYAPLKARMAIVPVTMDRVADAAVRDYRRVHFPHHRADHARHLLLPHSAGLPVDHAAGGVRCFAPRENHFAADGDRAAGRGSRWA
jgi:hypothetical protein